MGLRIEDLCRIGLTALLASLLLTPARAEVACETIGWLSALSNATASRARPGASPEDERIDLALILSEIGTRRVRSDIAAEFRDEPGREIQEFVGLVTDRFRAGDRISDERSQRMAERVGEIVRSMPCSSGDDFTTAFSAVPPKTSQLDSTLAQNFAPRHDAREGFDLVRVALAGMVTLGLAAAGWFAFYSSERQQRRSRRHACDIPARLSIGNHMALARVLDLSELGCRTNLPEHLEIGDAVRIDMLNRSITAHVVWSANGAAGLEFDKGIGIDGLAQLLADGKRNNRAERRMRRKAKAAGLS
ncbi:PilZ domain-containing protein [Palleronia aestuarii]|uniref:PilZ domain-containing protein n=1 Tax=Palleronia aestuarii TaxID=568105 RepID=A0A2W7P2R2_9RHOB|nr:PilZ domain-containing protein [Palleronia aestuarii]PZX17722.1 PilZ domain-containing protein [Palleronia aestuarii]